MKQSTARKKEPDRAVMRPLRPLGPPQAIELTEKLARDLLSINTYKAQRAVKPGHVARLVEKAQAGLFHDANIAIAEMPDGTRYLMNGQHCCHLVLQLKRSLSAVQQRFACQDDADLATLFSQFDTDIATRTIGDQLHAWVQGTELERFPIRCVRSVTEALAMLEHETKARIAWRAEERWAALYDNADLVPHIYKLVFGNRSNTARAQGFVLRSPVVAAMILTLRKNQPAAMDFWAKVREGEMLAKSDPAYKLREWLRSVSLSGMGRSLQATAGRREMLVRCIAGWNASRSGKSTVLRYISGAPLPHVRS